MIERAILRGWTQEERREVIETMLADVRGGATIRDRSAAARVLATLERNVIASERNEVLEHGQELGAATDRLRATLGSPEARQALAALSAASQGQPASNPVEPPADPETTKPLAQPEIRVEQGEGWASAGGAD